MDQREQISPTFDWDAFLADQGSLPYVPGVGTTPVVTMTTPKRAAVAPRARKLEGDIIVEESDSGELMGIANCHLVIETRWQCPRCHVHWKKNGRHNGVLRTCRCGAKFFLRVVPIG